MNNSVKHTFVICAYKESPYLEECVKSILEQDSIKKGISAVILYTSTINSYIEGVCEKYGLRIYTGKGGGIGADWNGALKATNTKYVTIVHQDDLYNSEYGKIIVDSFDSERTCNIIFSDYYEIDEMSNIRNRNINLKIKTLGLRILSIWDNKKYQRRIYSFGNFICCPAVSYNMERLKGFKFNENMKMAVDWDAWERIMMLPGSIKYIPLQLMAHRIHNESETTNNTVDGNREKEELLMFQRYWNRKVAKILMMFYMRNQKSNR